MTKTGSSRTKERILEKAEALFAEKGFHGVSIREITAAAKCNMASVHYHFNNKLNLYLEVFRARWIPREKRMFDAFLTSLKGEKEPPPSEIVTALARAYLKGPLTDEEHRRHRQLIIREMNNPTEAFKLAANESMRPLFETLFNLLKPSLYKGSEGNLIFDIMSIFGIVLYLNYSRPIISLITGKTYDDTFKTLLIDHMVRFSVNGLNV
jgi:AcrR family transcriptional regulator